MSKQDSHFFNNFSLVLGILVAVTIGLFAFARHVGAENQGKQVLDDPRYLQSVEERLQNRFKKWKSQREKNVRSSPR